MTSRVTAPFCFKFTIPFPVTLITFGFWPSVTRLCHAGRPTSCAYFRHSGARLDRLHPRRWATPCTSFQFTQKIQKKQCVTYSYFAIFAIKRLLYLRRWLSELSCVCSTYPRHRLVIMFSSGFESIQFWCSNLLFLKAQTYRNCLVWFAKFTGAYRYRLDRDRTTSVPIVGVQAYDFMFKQLVLFCSCVMD